MLEGEAFSWPKIVWNFFAGRARGEAAFLSGWDGLAIGEGIHDELAKV